MEQSPAIKIEITKTDISLRDRMVLVSAVLTGFYFPRPGPPPTRLGPPVLPPLRLGPLL